MADNIFSKGLKEKGTLYTYVLYIYQVSFGAILGLLVLGIPHV
jgi:hypothetical protein